MDGLLTSFVCPSHAERAPRQRLAGTDTGQSQLVSRGARQTARWLSRHRNVDGCGQSVRRWNSRPNPPAISFFGASIRPVHRSGQSDLPVARQRDCTGCTRERQSGSKSESSRRRPGGRSSDAAATLAGLNRLWKLDKSPAELAALAAELGSDIPFFFATPAAWCTGRGEIVTPVTVGKTLYFVIVSLPVGLSTADVYRGVMLPKRPENGEAIREALKEGRVSGRDCSTASKPWRLKSCVRRRGGQVRLAARPAGVLRAEVERACSPCAVTPRGPASLKVERRASDGTNPRVQTCRLRLSVPE